MERNHLGIILMDFARHLVALGHAPEYVHGCCRVAEHFGSWIENKEVRPVQVDESAINNFLMRHLPRCRCVSPAPVNPSVCRQGLRLLLEFLRSRAPAPEQTLRSTTMAERLVREYDIHLEQIGGLADATRLYRRRYARELLDAFRGRVTSRSVHLRPVDLTQWVLRNAAHLKPQSVGVLATSLRSFLRFLYLTGRAKVGLADAVPRPAPSPFGRVPPILTERQLRGFLKGFDRKTPAGCRDFAIAVCMCRLGLRTSETAALGLEDLDWKGRSLRLARTKQRREILLPLPSAVARAIQMYLEHGRPQTVSRALFVRLQAPLGKGLLPHHVRGAMRRALARCGMPSMTVHALRHTYATRLHRRGVGLKAIADLLGHKSLDTAARYARVDLDELGMVAIPWPGTRP